MEATHTPGPWYIGQNVPNNCLIIEAQQGPVLNEIAWLKSDSQSLANALLIAAAPKLLDLVKLSILHMMEAAPYPEYLRKEKEYVALARAAIAKVERADK